MNKVLLTGATGFLGSHLLEALLRQGDRVTILKRSTSDTWRIRHLLDDVETFDVDVQPLEDAFKAHEFHAVIHTACAYGRSGEPAHKVVETNVLFSLRLLDTAISFRTQTFINTDTFFNTSQSLHKYLGTYSLSKKQFLEWLNARSAEIQVINLKLQHVYGPKDEKTKFIPWLLNQFSANPQRISLTEGHQLRDFIYVNDVASAYTTILNNRTQIATQSEFDVGTGKIVRLSEFIIQLYQEYKRQKPTLTSELGFGDIAMNPGETMNVNVDISKLKNLGWAAKENGISITISQAIEND